MEEKELKAKDIPWGYALCFNDACGLKDKCMHYQARLLTAEGRYVGQAVYPTAWPISRPSDFISRARWCKHLSFSLHASLKHRA